MGAGGGHVDQPDVGQAIAADMLAEVAEDGRHGLDGHDLARGAHPARGKQREVTDVGADIDEYITVAKTTEHPGAEMRFPAMEVVEHPLDPVAGMPLVVHAVRRGDAVLELAP